MTPTSSPKRLVVAINPFARFGSSRDVGPMVTTKLRALGHEVIDLVAPTYEDLIADARHAPHLEARDITLSAIVQFITDLQRRSRP